jgi:hypothetical protein
MMTSVIVPCLLDEASLHSSLRKAFFLLEEDDRDLCWFHCEGDLRMVKRKENCFMSVPREKAQTIERRVA